MAKKTWIEKRDCDKSYKIKTIDKKFADIPGGSKMFISTPELTITLSIYLLENQPNCQQCEMI